MNIKKVKVEELKPYDSNPRKIKDTHFTSLKNSLKTFGLVQPLIVNKEYKVIGGNQRLKAIQELDFDEVSVIVVDLPPSKEKALNLALNSKYLQGEFTPDINEMLSDILENDIQLYDDLDLRSLDSIIDDDDIFDDDDEVEITEEKHIPEMDLMPFESYDYLVILCTDTRDFNYLTSLLKIDKVDASVPESGKKIGLGRAIPFSRIEPHLKKE